MPSHFTIMSPVIYTGDFTVAAGAGANQILEVEECTASLNVAVAFPTTGYSAGAIDGALLITLPPDAQYVVRINDHSIANLENIVLGSEKFVATTNEAVGFGGSIDALAQTSFAMIPFFQRADAAAAENGIWSPSVFVTGIDNVSYNRPQRNASSNNQLQATFRAARAQVDQAAQAIPANAQYGWFGKPAALAFVTVWNLPTAVV